MNWESFYLVCFVVGFIFTLLSFLSGAMHLNLHLGHGHFHAGGHGGTRGGAHFAILSPMTIAVFLSWFGGAGYLLVHLRHIWAFAGFILASLAGITGAGVVALFVAKVLMKEDYTMDPADYEMVGVLGTVTGAIRKDGVGEIIFEQQGSRRASAACSDQGEPIARGEEVVVTRYEKGVAYVRKWNELAERAGIPTEEKREQQ